ncbi:serine/threonine protein kinase (plasmid) [Pseudonocardia sp. EC080610-09]|uniref:SDR family oxidoreductase n=1 Tax=unclassified Pseudonocardia TaxID=2619320 RepID=UPI000706C43F|nr:MULTISPECIES: SDR family oxidoreductase [unclassified Pseudonocardia]ALL79736.1 serine/threonine protein kinase [Pseudonocardia sp. EC080610-09]ALL85169.1 serine/threonine protein kinase [Pseudonocardia sp. EC080619-01]
MAGVEGRVVAVTGGGNGLGREYARVLAAAGSKVVVNDLGGARDGSGGASEAADQVVAEIVAAGGEAVANYDSVATREGGQAVVQTALDNFGRIDGVVANAGILRDRAFHKMSDEDWDAVQQVHLYGGYHVIHAAWPYFREQQHGRIVVATSTSGIYGNFGQANYGAAKSGLIGLVLTLAIEGRKSGIRANAVAPMAATRMTEDIATPDLLAKLDPAHVAPVVGHLLTDECDESGSVLVAGGGQVHRVRQFQTKGVAFAEVPTIEQVGDRWSEIVDLDGATPGVNPVG